MSYIPKFQKLKDIMDDLVSEKLVDIVKVKMKSGRGQEGQYVFLTAKGLATIGEAIKGKRSGTKHTHFFLQRVVQWILSLKPTPIDSELECPSPLDPLKKVDLGIPSLKTCVEICHSTFSTEPDQCHRDLEAGWSYVLCLAATGKDLKRLENEFLSQREIVNPHITLCMPCHLKENLISEIINWPHLVYGKKYKA